MKKLYYVNTNGYDFLMTDDGETRRIILDQYCPRDDDGEYIGMDEFLASVEDDSGWEQFDETAEGLTAFSRIVAQVDRPDL